MGAPYWNDSARGLIGGLTLGSTLPHLARDTIEAIAYQVRDVFDEMHSEAGTELKVLLADGGATGNNQLMQFQSYIIGRPVWRSTSAVASPLGAAYLAGLAVGTWRTLDEIAQLPRPRAPFEPRIAERDRARLYTGWQTIVARATLGTSKQG